MSGLSTAAADPREKCRTFNYSREHLFSVEVTASGLQCLIAAIVDRTVSFRLQPDAILHLPKFRRLQLGSLS